MVSLSSHTGVTPGSLRTTAFAWKRRRATAHRLLLVDVPGLRVGAHQVEEVERQRQIVHRLPRTGHHLRGPEVRLLGVVALDVVQKDAELRSREVFQAVGRETGNPQCERAGRWDLGPDRGRCPGVLDEVDQAVGDC